MQRLQISSWFSSQLAQTCLLVGATVRSNPSIKARTDFYLHRVREEFYDMTYDRCERNNLIGDAARQTEIEGLRQDLLKVLWRTGDPLAEAFAHRDDPFVLAAALQKLSEEYGLGPKAKGDPKDVSPR